MGVRGGGGAKSYNGKKVWSAINQPILSGPTNRSIAFLIRTKHIQLTNCRVALKIVRRALRQVF